MKLCKLSIILAVFSVAIAFRPSSSPKTAMPVSLSMNLGNWFKGLFTLPEPPPPYNAPYSLSDSAWAAKLSADEYYVLRQAGTERPWTSNLNDEKRKGKFTCKGCGSTLFDSSTKFNSGTGWPSFYTPETPTSVVERTDNMLGISRTEVLCSNCGGHLGHVFNDGPRPTGLRYCMNGVSLKFKQEGSGDSSEGKGSTKDENLKGLM